VLDDVWSDVAWKKVLENAFRAGARGGSRVLVTTRKEMVALQMKAVHIHWVKKLKPEDGWRLLKNQVRMLLFRVFYSLSNWFFA